MKHLCVLALFFCVFGCTPKSADTNSLLSADLTDILNVVVATNSPMINLAGNLTTILQVSLPPCKGVPPDKIGETALVPFDDTAGGIRLTISIDSHSTTQLITRADVTFFDPKRGYANMGAEWQALVFRKLNNKWVFHESLGGAIK